MSWRKEFARGDATVQVALRHVSGDHYQVQVGDTLHDVEATPLPDGRVRFSLGGKTFDADGASFGETTQVRLAGRTWSLSHAKARGAGAAESDGTIQAPMTGTVARVMVQQGDTVEVGDPIIVITAMKMEHKLTAGTKGVIAELNAAEGATVDQGAILARIENE